jgi:ribonuclease E
MRMIMPTHAKAVQPYNDPTPLFARYQVESYLGGMFNPTVQLKSGGYIVIGITEALVAIDVNSGRATKEGSIEETATKTNLEAAEEVARQLRLRDLAGLIVIDFIDMEDRRNNLAVEKKLKDKLKTDRARIQVGRISGFGLLEMSRQRLRPGMLESTTQPCAHCHGTGLIRSDDSMALQILRALEEEGTRKRSREVLLRAPIAVVNFLMNQKREHIAMIEARYGMSVRIECDPSMISPDYTIEKFKTATRVVAEVSAAISGNSSFMGAVEDDIVDPDIPSEEEENAEVEAVVSASDEEPKDGNGRKKRRRRRRRRSGSGSDENGADGKDSDESDADGDDAETAAPVAASAESATESATEEAPAADTEAAPKKRTRSRSRKPKVVAEATEAVAEPAVNVPAVDAAEGDAEQPKPKPKRTRKPKAKVEAPVVAQPPVADATQDTAPAVAAEPETPKPEPVPEPVAAPTPEPAPSPDVQPVEPIAAKAEDAPKADTAEEVAKPKRRGWWNLGL